MLVTRREGFSTAPIASPGAARSSGTRHAKAPESSFDQITLSAATDRNAFRQMVSDLAYQVRTHNTTGKIQELRSQVASGEYRPDARETAARMLLLSEEEA